MSDYSDDDHNSDDSDDDSYVPYSSQHFQGLIESLYSSKLDSFSSHKRNAVVEEALLVLEENEDAVLDDFFAVKEGGLGWDAANGCASLHGLKRILKIFNRVLVIACNNKEENGGDLSIITNIVQSTCQLYVHVSTLYPTSDAIGKSMLNYLNEDLKKHETILKEALGSLVNSSNSAKHYQWAPALSFLSALTLSREEKDNFLTVFKKLALSKSTATSSGKFPPRHIVLLSRNFVLSLSSEEFNTQIGPSLLLKWKGNPETFLETAVGLLSVFCANGKKNQSENCPKAYLEGLVTCAFQSIRSNKPPLCDTATEILLLLLCKPMAAWSDAVIKSIVTEFLTAYSAKPGKGGTVQPYSRMVAYTVMGHVALLCCKNANLCSKADAGKVLECFEGTIQKDSDWNTKEAGVGAFLAWIKLAHILLIDEKKMGSSLLHFTQILSGDDKKSSSSTSSGHSDFRSWIGTLVEFATLGNETWPFHQFISQINKVKNERLLSILEQSQKKSVSSNSVAQVDGLIALYVILRRCINTSASPPTQVSKVFSSKSSFLYAPPMMESIGSDPSVASLLPRCILSQASLLKPADKPKFYSASSPPIQALAACLCLAQPATNRDTTDILEAFWKDDEITIEAITEALFQVVNGINQRTADQMVVGQSTKNGRELFEPICNFTAETKQRLDCTRIRYFANRLVTEKKGSLVSAKRLALTHFGTGLKSEGPQRNALVRHVVKFGAGSFEGDTFAEFIVNSATYFPDSEDELGDGVHRSAVSLLLTLGNMAGFHDAEEEQDEDMSETEMVYAKVWEVCVDVLPHILAKNLMECTAALESYTEEDMDMYRCPDGTLYKGKNGSISSSDTASTAAVKKTKAASATRKGKSSFSNNKEDEEWERQIRQELADKKKTDDVSDQTLTKQEQEVLQQQAQKRNAMDKSVTNFRRSLRAITALCNSDLIVGNAVLPLVSPCVLQAANMKCPIVHHLTHLQSESRSAFKTLTLCVYELDDPYLPEILLAVQHKKDKDQPVVILPIATPCPPPLEEILSGIEESELNRSSFEFIMPMLQSVLTGARTPFSQSEQLSLSIISQHIAFLTKSTRKNIAMTLLEFIQHDRSLSSSPTRVLSEVYDVQDGYLTPGEIAPLLGSEGALSPHFRVRLASIRVLGEILSRGQDLSKNPLVESRIWLNCFSSSDEEEGELRDEARAAWKILRSSPLGEKELSPPGKLYGMALFPLINSDKQVIATMASKAYAAGMTLVPESTEKSVLKLANAYVEAYPSHENGTSASSADDSFFPPPPPPSKAKKPLISTGFKKKTKKSSNTLSSASKMGQGLTSGSVKKSAGGKKTLSKIAVPKKEERTFDKSILESQFVSVKKKSQDEDTEGKISLRKGVLLTFSSIPEFSSELPISVLKILVEFLIAYGMADTNADVRTLARDTTRDIIARFGDGEESITFLLPCLESILDTSKQTSKKQNFALTEGIPSQKIRTTVDAADYRKEGAVIALGSVALHLLTGGVEKYHDKILNILKLLQEALRTPSEEVQSSSALCIEKLFLKMKKIKEMQPSMESSLRSSLADCLTGKTLAVQRGGAYGVASSIKGMGISSLKKYSILDEIRAGLESPDPSQKEGALFAIELLSKKIKLLFEPYIITLLPSLLPTFGDQNDHVREAASKTSGVIMSQLSAHGVKLFLPPVMSSLDQEDVPWRTKAASISMLGSMSHCAPKQLSACLPKIVPRLTEAFADTHAKVRIAANEALEELSGVIRNPEIRDLRKVLLKALTDPANHTADGLDALIQTEFLHAMDASSLAIVAPILRRGLRDRSAGNKRRGALIVGNMCAMIADPKDFLPYLETLLEELQNALLDPIPDVRATSAKAMGSLVRGLGEEKMPRLRVWLMETVKDGAGSVERSGAAQGLAEVVIAAGSDAVDGVLMKELLPLMKEGNRPSAGAREGVLWVLTFLPPGLGAQYSPYITKSLPALLAGLSDDEDQVREVALRAGRVLIKSHGKTHVDKILPSLERGMEDEDNVRIRLSSVTLLGDLLALIGNTKVTAADSTDTQEDIRQTERAQHQISLALGKETRLRILAGLYLSRSDTASVVRQAALMVWKSVVSVTNRTLKEIMPVLVDKIVFGLGSSDFDRVEVAGRCLGDVVVKLGDMNTLPIIVPVLQSEMKKGHDPSVRLGVCVGLAEVLDCSSKESIMRHLPILITLVQDALCDSDTEVRSKATLTFQSLFRKIGMRSMEEIVPPLLARMDEKALHGLTGILSVRSRELLPYIVPKLLHRPITITHADALTKIASVTGRSIHLHFGALIPALLTELTDMEDEIYREEAIRNCIKGICSSVEEAGVNVLVSEMVAKVGNDRVEFRVEACWMLGVLVEERHEFADFYEQVPIMYRDLLYRLNDGSPEVITAANKTLITISKKVPAEELVQHAEFCRNLIASMVSDCRRRKGGVGDGEFFLPGLNIKGGLDPFIPMFQRGILYGSPESREICASGLGELLKIMQPKYLPPQVMIKITGPLLRVVGDRNTPPVKIALVQTLGLILTKGGMALRAFVPQFQTTFVKSLSDPSRAVRMEAIAAFAKLLPLSTRLDPLIKELVSGSLGKSGEEVEAIQTATLEALSVVLHLGGKKAKLPESLTLALEASQKLLFSEHEGMREAAAKVLGAVFPLIKEEDVQQEVISEVLLGDEGRDEKETQHARAFAIYRVLSMGGADAVSQENLKKMTVRIKLYTQNESVLVRRAGCIALGALIGASGKGFIPTVESTILSLISKPGEDVDVHCGLARGLCVALKLSPDVFRGKRGLPILDNSLKLAMSGVKRVQYAFHDFLWLAFGMGDVESGEENELLSEYLSLTNFENSKTIKTLSGKVLGRIKSVNEEAL